MASENEIIEALKQVMDPELGRSLVDLNMVRNLKLDEKGLVSFTLTLTVPSCPMRNQMAEQARKVLCALPGVSDVRVDFGSMTAEERQALLGVNGPPALPKLVGFNKINQVIAVMSGKGGVGKSSVTALLAAALNRAGKKVGILDADITGPSIPKLFGLPPGGLRGGEQGMLPAVTRTGIKVVSANLMLKTEDTAVIWRGPMISGLIKQFWTDTLWGRLDYLLVDLPPGTSDAALSVTQNLPLNSVVLVTTPQDLAALVVKKAIHMLEQVQIPVLGVVENMSYFACPDTGKHHEIFGPSHLGEIRKLIDAPLSARLPIRPEVAMLSDAGQVEDVRVDEMSTFAEQLTQTEPLPARLAAQP